MSDTMLFSVLFFGIWALVGIVFLAVGLGFRRSRKRREEQCTLNVSASVKEITWSQGTGYPVVCYRANGKDYEQRLSSGSSRVRYAIGDKLTVWYDPADPTVIYSEADNAMVLFERIFISVGIVCLLIGAAVAGLAQVLESRFL